MATRSSQCVEAESTSSGPIIEHITELCDFCIELTQAMVNNQFHDWEVFHRFKTATPDFSSDSCQLCEIIASDCSITLTELKRRLHNDRHTRRRWAPSDRQVRICGADIGKSTFTMWAEKGRKSERSHYLTILTRELRQRCVCNPGQSPTNCWPKFGQSMRSNQRLARTVQDARTLSA